MTVGKRRLAKASALSPAEMHEVADKVSAGETQWLVSGALSLRPSLVSALMPCPELPLIAVFKYSKEYGISIYQFHHQKAPSPGTNLGTFPPFLLFENKPSMSQQRNSP